MKDHLVILLMLAAMLAGLYAMVALFVHDWNVCREVGHSVFYCLRNR